MCRPEWDKRNDMVVHEDMPFNAESPRAALADQPITPIAAFYARNHGPIPSLDPVTWRLHIEGMVERPLALSLDDLQRDFESSEVTATLQCAGNRRAGLIEVRHIPGQPWGAGAISTAAWRGVRLGDVLGAAGLSDGAAHIAFEGPDVAEEARPPQAFGASVDRCKALAPETLLAWEMNGVALPRVHGGPVRVVVPGYIGARSVKWVERIIAQGEPSDNYFQAVAYRLHSGADPAEALSGGGEALGPVALSADILHPDDGDHLPPGPTAISGYALAPDGEDIDEVTVSIDGGRTWMVADLGDPPSRWSWWPWRMVVDLPAGETEILARARDATGRCQPERAREIWNPHGYVNNSWARVRVTAGPR